MWLWLVFSSGGYSPHQWLPASLAVGLFGLVVASLAAYPRRPGQLSLAVLAILACYGIWVAVSAFWAASPTRAWMEGGRTFTYVLVFALALAFFTDDAARHVFRYLLVAAALVLVTVCIWRLWSSSNVAGLFLDKMLSYPTRYHNNDAALFLVGFWPLMWLAAGSEEHAPVRGLALGLATGLLGLAVMTQSRGAMWSLGISLVFMFVVSPVRLRTLLYLLVPALLMFYAFPNLNRYWLEGPETVGGGVAARTLLLVSITAAFMGMIIALLERWIRVSMRMKAIFAVVVLLAVVAGGVYGSFTLTSDIGGPVKWLSRTWHQFTDLSEEQETTTGRSRFTIVSSSGRVDLWGVAWKAFEEAPVLGVGADNFVYQYDRLRRLPNQKAQQAHSLEMQVLGETGAVGGVLFAGGLLLSLVGLLRPRWSAGWRKTREAWRQPPDSTSDDPPADASPVAQGESTRWGNDPRAYGWEMALLAGLAYWFVHASVDWLWQMAGVGIPALLMLAAAIASVDSRAGALWPRLRERLRFKRIARRLQPSGALSLAFRVLLGILAVVVLIVCGLPYLSLLYQDSAKALSHVDGVRAVERAAVAHSVQPLDPAPFVAQASIYEYAASGLASTTSEAAAAVYDNLALTLDRLELAIAHDPADWSLRYSGGVAALNLLLAESYVAGLDPQLDYAALIPAIPGLYDWSPLLGSTGDVPAAGVAAGSLAIAEQTRQVAESYRGLSRPELAQRALGFFDAAKERNPFGSHTERPSEIVRTVMQLETAQD